MRSVGSNIAAIALAIGLLVTCAASSAEGQEPPVYGSQLMTKQERQAYQARLRSATNEERREQIRAEHHAQMQERAKEMGVKLPDEPPMGSMGGQRTTPPQGGWNSSPAGGRGGGRRGG